MGRGHKAKYAKKKPKNATRFKKVPRQKNNNACMTSSPAPPSLQTTLPAALAEAALYRVPSLCFDATLPASDRGYQQVERSAVWSLVLDRTQWKSHRDVAKLITQYYRALDIHPVKNWKNPRLLLPRSLARMALLLAEATRAVGPQEESLISNAVLSMISPAAISEPAPPTWAFDEPAPHFPMSSACHF